MSTEEDFISPTDDTEDIDNIIDHYSFTVDQRVEIARDSIIKEVEKFILKNISKFDPDTLTDIADMWHAIGGDPELSKNKEIG